VKAAGGRISQALHDGRITHAEYVRAEARVIEAERRFGMHSTVYPELTAAATSVEEQAEGLSDTVKLGAIGTVLAGTALLAWYCRPKSDLDTKKVASGWYQPSAQTGARFIPWPGEAIPPSPIYR